MIEAQNEKNNIIFKNFKVSSIFLEKKYDTCRTLHFRKDTIAVHFWISFLEKKQDNVKKDR